MNVLLLGGYQFLGRAIVAVAQSRGHAVTVFNRGRSDPAPGAETILGERDDPRPLAGRRWDAVVDTSGYLPRHVRAAAALLRDAVERYIFVSSLSVYAPPFAAGFDESAPRLTLPVGVDPDGGDLLENYGEKKALCEDAAEAAMPGRSVAVRAGFIVGPYDYSDRFNSWIERSARDEPMLVPGEASAPFQLVDVRDIAAWIVSAAEERLHGAFNVSGPLQPLTVLDAARACIAGTGSRAEPIVVSSEVVRAAGITGWEQLPFWFEPELYGMMQMSIERARATGLRTRPLADTVRDTFAWLRTTDHRRLISLPPELERAALAGP